MIETETPKFNSAHDLRERGFQLRTPPVTIVNFDPAGDGDDNDALVAISREEHQKGEPHDPDFAVEFMFRLLMAHRMPKAFEFPDKLASLIAMDRTLRSWTKAGRQSAHVWGVETNGVGYGYASSLARNIHAKVMPYSTVGQVSATAKPPVGAKFSMPRLKSLDNFRVLIETGYFKMVPGAPGAKEFTSEMGAFVWKTAGRPEAMTGQHDDLVMAATGAVWIGSKVLPPMLKQVKVGDNHRRAVGARMRIN